MAGATNGYALPFGSTAIPRRAFGVSGVGGKKAIGIGRLYYGRVRYVLGFSGTYKVAGTVTESGTVPNSSRHVFLVPRSTPSLVIADATTEPSVGTFSFEGLAPGKYIVWAINPDGSEDGVIHDFIDAVPM